MGLRGRLKKLERSAVGELGSFELRDGSRYFFDRLQTYVAVFLHWSECGLAGNPPDWPEPPEVLRRLCEAKDVRAALEEVPLGGTDDFLPYDREILINERTLEPRSLVAGRDPYDQAVEDLSE
jgi:hypothetical protein